jgi:choline-glycine betaine transporter
MDLNFTVIAALMLCLWVWQLFTGRAHERLGPPTDRRTNPVRYWLAMLVQAAVMGFLFWMWSTRNPF